MKNKSVIVSAVLVLVMFSSVCTFAFVALTAIVLRNETEVVNVIYNGSRGYSIASAEAESIFYKVISGNEEVTGVDYVSVDDEIVACYSVAIDELKQLDIEILLKPDGYTILKWEQTYIGDWNPDTSLNLWDGGT